MLRYADVIDRNTKKSMSLDGSTWGRLQLSIGLALSFLVLPYDNFLKKHVHVIHWIQSKRKKWTWMEVDLWLSRRDPSWSWKGASEWQCGTNPAGWSPWLGSSGAAQETCEPPAIPDSLPQSTSAWWGGTTRILGPDLDPHRLEGRKQVAPLRLLSHLELLLCWAGQD